MNNHVSEATVALDILKEWFVRQGLDTSDVNLESWDYLMVFGDAIVFTPNPSKLNRSYLVKNKQVIPYSTVTSSVEEAYLAIVEVKENPDT